MVKISTTVTPASLAMRSSRSTNGRPSARAANIPTVLLPAPIIPMSQRVPTQNRARRSR